MEKLSDLTEDKDRIYSFWNRIPAILERNTNIADKISEVEVRKILIRIMAKGVKDDLFNTGDIRRRYAMTPKEMFSMVNLELDNDIKLSNIYFHLDKLIEYDLIEIIAEIQEGKYRNRYFGRKAKLYVFTTTEDDIDTMENMNKYSFTRDLLVALNPTVDESELLDTMKKYLKSDINVKNKVIKWFDDNHEILTKLNYDITELYLFIMSIYSNSENRLELEKVRNIFKL